MCLFANTMLVRTICWWLFADTQKRVVFEIRFVISSKENSVMDRYEKCKKCGPYFMQVMQFIPQTINYLLWGNSMPLSYGNKTRLVTVILVRIKKYFLTFNVFLVEWNYFWYVPGLLTKCIKSFKTFRFCIWFQIYVNKNPYMAPETST